MIERFFKSFDVGPIGKYWFAGVAFLAIGITCLPNVGIGGAFIVFGAGCIFYALSRMIELI
jgi:hypothetical protein